MGGRENGDRVRKAGGVQGCKLQKPQTEAYLQDRPIDYGRLTSRLKKVVLDDGVLDLKQARGIGT